MPIPQPDRDEDKDGFVSRCISQLSENGEFDDDSQRAAVCYSSWDESKKQMNQHDQLVKAIRSRQGKQTEFNRGILTADRYVKTLLDCAGSDLCYRYAAKGNISFQDVLTKAAKTLTYNNQDMLLEEKMMDSSNLGSLMDKNGEQIELPKNTLMVFRHVLTTPRKDRDGDILRTKGAQVDPKMLLLWQHVHTLPIGKMLYVYEHNPKKMSVVTAIIDINELAHDAAVMVDNKMGRFSHGFRALEFTTLKEADGRTTGDEEGFDVKSFEIMEESLVSVPSNVDSDTEEIILSLVDNEKLKSPMMKEVGSSIKTRRKQKAIHVPVILDISLDTKGLTTDMVHRSEQEVDEEEIETKEEENNEPQESNEEDEKGTGCKEGDGECPCGAGPGEECECPEKTKESSSVKADDDGYEEDIDPEHAKVDKALIDDQESGGQEAAPPKFDPDMIVEDDDEEKRSKKGDTEPVKLSQKQRETIENAIRRDWSKIKLIKAVIGKKSFYATVDGSWESISEELAQKAKPYLISQGLSVGDDDFVSTVATYPDYVVLCCYKDGKESYYKVAWQMQDGKPTFIGEVKSVEFDVEIKPASEVVNDYRMVNREDLSTYAERNYSRRIKRMDATDVMELFLEKADDDDRERMIEVIEAIKAIEGRSKQTKEVLEFLS